MTVSKRVIITAALITAVWLALGAGAPTTALAASTRIVDNDYPSSSACHGAGYATIQDAVNSFLPGQSGTIKVCTGIYTENVSITGLGKIKLLGKPGVIVTTSNPTALVTATNTTQLTVQGFTLDGAAQGITDGMIYFQNSSGVVTKNVFQNSTGGSGIRASLNSGASSLKVIRNKFTGVGVGLEAISASASGLLTAEVSGNDITGSFIGIFITTTTGNATATVTGNRLQGTDTGIRLQSISNPRVSGNKINGFVSGIALADVSLATVSGNTVRTTGVGISIAPALISASLNKVQGNSIEALANGFIGIRIVKGPGTTADFNQIKGNKITDPDAAYTNTTGILLSNSGGSMTATVIQGNKLTNMDTPYFHSGDTGTVISGNHCAPTAPCITP